MLRREGGEAGVGAEKGPGHSAIAAVRKPRNTSRKVKGGHGFGVNFTPAWLNLIRM